MRRVAVVAVAVVSFAMLTVLIPFEDEAKTLRRHAEAPRFEPARVSCTAESTSSLAPSAAPVDSLVAANPIDPANAEESSPRRLSVRGRVVFRGQHEIPDARVTITTRVRREGRPLDGVELTRALDALPLERRCRALRDVPSPDATAWLDHEVAAETTTDASGRFSVEGLDPGAALEIWAFAHRGGERVLVGAKGAHLTGAATDLDLGSIEVELVHTLAVRLVPHGAPLREARVELVKGFSPECAIGRVFRSREWEVNLTSLVERSQERFSERSTRTFDGDRIVQPMVGYPLGWVDLTVRAPGFASEHRRLDRERDEPPSSELVVDLVPAAAASGRVVDETGRGVAGAKVTALDGEFPIEETATDANGRFELRALAASRSYRVHVRPEKELVEALVPFAPPGEVTVNLATASSLDLNVAFERDALPEGEEASRIVVALWRDGSSPAWARLGATRATSPGPARFTGLPPGRYRVELWGEGFAPTSPEVVLEPGRTTTFTLETRRGRCVTVRVVDPEGRPLGASARLPRGFTRSHARAGQPLEVKDLPWEETELDIDADDFDPVRVRIPANVVVVPDVVLSPKR